MTHQPKEDLPKPHDGMTPEEKGELLQRYVKSGTPVSSLDFSGASLVSRPRAEFGFAPNTPSLDLGADLTGADLRGVMLDGSGLAGCSLTLADLSAASLRGAVLTGADISNANLAGADLTGASVDKCQS